MKKILPLCILYILLSPYNIKAQGLTDIPKTYIIDQIIIEGTKTLDNSTLLRIAKLNIGDTITIPSDTIAKVINRLWEESLFSNISIDYDIIQGNKIRLKLNLYEKPRLGEIELIGLKKKEMKEISELASIT